MGMTSGAIAGINIPSVAPSPTPTVSEKPFEPTSVISIETETALQKLQAEIAAAKSVDKVYIYRDPRGMLYSQNELPKRGTTEAAAYDVKAFLPDVDSLKVYPLRPVLIPTGLFVAIPKNSVLLVCSRSGLSTKGLFLPNAPGILDSDYRGELAIPFIYVAPPDAEPYVVKHGDRIAQLVFVQASALSYPEFVEVRTHAELPTPDSNRVGGFGSTGK